uniref:Golgi apparatus membrane protein TVP15 n=1 Tax=Globisporangium ultimum (strain ATCC 200006 / CBS 805.95 / DAOM BR144) TaxID=431595 RepID=K3WM18_GLOUD
MMEPTASTTAAAPAPPARQVSNLQVPQVFKEKADALAQQISGTDIKRINGYMRLANLLCAALLTVTCVIRLFSVPSYAHFLVVIYIMFLAGALVFIENHEQFPSVAEKVKTNFGFMFTAFGKAAFILSISFLAFSQGTMGVLIGVLFFVLALFNFFLIYRHPAYQSTMTKTEGTHPQDEDLEDMPELRYNTAPVATAAATTTIHATTTTTTKTAHVVV